MVLDFKCPVEEAQNLLRRAQASQNKEIFLEVENLLRPDPNSDLGSMDNEELELYLKASLHYAAMLLQECEEEGADYTPIQSRARQLLKFDLNNPHALWIDGMCRLKQNDPDGVDSLGRALNQAKRMGIPEVPQWEKELTRIQAYIREQRAKMGMHAGAQQQHSGASSSSSPAPMNGNGAHKKEAPKIEELDSETPLQKGFFNSNNSNKKKEKPATGATEKMKPVNGKAPMVSVVREPETELRERKKAGSAQSDELTGAALETALSRFQTLLREAGEHQKTWFEEEAVQRKDAEKCRKEDHGDMLQLLEEKMDAVPEAVETIKSKAEDFQEILDQLQNQVSRTNVESIQVKQDAHEVLQESRKQRIACEEAKTLLAKFVKEGQDMLNSSNLATNAGKKQDKSNKDAEKDGQIKIKVVEIEISAFKQPKVWIAIIISFLAGLLMMLGVIVEVYGAWGCQFTCHGR